MAVDMYDGRDRQNMMARELIPSPINGMKGHKYYTYLVHVSGYHV